VQWYDTLNNLIQTGDTLNPAVTPVGTYTYYVNDSTPGCSATAFDTVTLTIMPLPPTPTAFSDTVICFNDANPTFGAIGDSLTWYDDAGLTNIVGTGNSYTPIVALPNSYTFYVTATDSITGCEGYADSVTLDIVTFTPLPMANDTFGCFSDAIPDLEAIGTEVKWYSNPSLTNLVYTGSPFPTGQTQVGVYTYYVTQTIGCMSLPDTVTLTIHPKPLVTLSTYDTSIVAGDSIQLQAFNAVTYIWSPTTGLNPTTGPVVMASPPATTIYTVMGTAAWGCSNTASVTVKVYPLGTDPYAMDISKLAIYPNPSRGEFVIEFRSAQSEPVQLNIFNEIGQLVVAEELKSGTGRFRKEFDLKEFASGVYQLQIVSEAETINRKIMLAY
jgi:hypothetical protein